MPRAEEELKMTEQRQRVWEALKRLDKERAKHQGAVAWPPRLSRIAEVADVAEGTVPGIMLMFTHYELIDYRAGDRLVFLREPAEGVRQ
jgi:hypothetical protein